MPDDGDPPLLEVDIARKAHRRGAGVVETIDKLSFALAREKVTCLLGPSGCGKTTTLRIILGLDSAFEGRVAPSIRDLRLGVVFQDPRLLPWYTIDENVRLAAPQMSADALSALLDELGLLQWRRHRPNQLSLGMARRVALARALAVEPDLLVLDEAFVSLDEQAADALRAVVFAAVDRRRATVLMVTHNINEALSFSDAILVLAPRPTHVVDTVRLDTPRAARDGAWIDDQRGRVAGTRSGLLDRDI